MPVALSVKHQISAIIRRFKFEELEDAVLPVFPEVSWTDIKSRLVKDHESLTTLHALKIIEQIIKEFGVAEKELIDRLAMLEITDVSRHYRRKTWYCHEFKGTSVVSHLTFDELSERIKSSFNNHHMKVDVQILLHNDIIFLSIKDRPKKKQTTKILPTYFSWMSNENFFFCSKRIVLKSVLIALTDSMGYQSCRLIKLMGKDIPSLIKMLLDRKAASSKGNIVKPPLRFQQTNPTLTSLGLDFTQHKQRMKYAENCFGYEPPTFEQLRIKSSDQHWKNREDKVQLPDDVIYTGIEFQSTSIPSFLKNLVIQRILVAPLPCYAANILTLARNDLTLKEG
ncbi:uncharacterized protein LOC106642425 isoform X2 [Copidosoma floridanum]|uniref:uncharacterized protein LOC106642425 isoform X2 n=1 Tax=Copidosoma floridanum TaxID=29053 RepID=UPI000C6F8332|nr:uncharacterized protein LOC106642425 isoform X2 [Copidosoma floridanum]